jgi:hypothetical protein
MTTPADKAFELANWQTGSLRVTGFTIDPVAFDTVNWWETLTGQASESKNLRPGSGQLVELGTHAGKILQLQIQPGRVDWLLLPKDDPDSVKFASLGAFEESLTSFTELVSKWFVNAPAMNRIALGVQLLLPTANYSEAVHILAGILDYVNINWDGIQEFMLQLNRPEISASFPDLGAINRLVKWQTIVRKKILAALAPQPQAPVTTSEEFAVYCELDINTTPPADARTKLPPEKLTALLVELGRIAAAVKFKGLAQ